MPSLAHSDVEAAEEWIVESGVAVRWSDVFCAVSPNCCAPNNFTIPIPLSACRGTMWQKPTLAHFGSRRLILADSGWLAWITDSAM